MSFMRRLLFLSSSVAGTLFTASSLLGADVTNAPAARRHLDPPTGVTAKQPAIAGVAVGGPIGVLTDQQRASYEAALKQLRGQMMELEFKLRAARQDLVNASLTGKFDENLIRQKALTAARIEAELTVLRVKAFSEVQPPPTPEQIEKIKAGKPGPIHRLARPEGQRQLRREASPVTTNSDLNGLPPKH